jgi:hypothetical protein
MVAVCCLFSILHMEFPPVHNSHPSFTISLIKLNGSQQQWGMLEMIFKLIEKDFQLSYWKIDKYIC